jgi:hypothetical protein
LGRLPVAQMAILLDELSLARRALDQALKAARHFARLRALVAPGRAEDARASADEKAEGNGRES